MSEVLKSELVSAMKRLESQMKVLRATNDVLDEALANGWVILASAAKNRQKRQQLAVDATQALIVELRSGIDEDQVPLPLEKPQEASPVQIPPEGAGPARSTRGRPGRP